MKNVIKFSLLAFLIMGSIACKKENKEDNKNPQETNNNQPATLEEKVEGEWMMTEFNQSGESKSSGQVIGTHTGTGSNFEGSLKFISDKTYSGDLSYDLEIITDIMGLHTDTTTVSLDGFLANGNWEVNADDEIVFTTDNGESSTMEVVSATSSKLVLHSQVEQSETQAGMTVTTTVDVDFVLEK